MKIISDHDLLQKYIETYHIDRFFPEKYFDFLLLTEYKRGEYICRQGYPLDSLYFFLEGKLKIVRALSNGKENVLDIREVSCILGEIEFMIDQPLVSSVIAMKKSLVIHFPVVNLREALMSDVHFLNNISYWLAKELYESDISRSVNVIYSVKEQLAMYILATQQNGRFSLDLGPLADSFGTSYRHLLRVINQFIGDGVIEKGKNSYRILNPDTLESYISK